MRTCFNASRAFTTKHTTIAQHCLGDSVAAKHLESATADTQGIRWMKAWSKLTFAQVLSRTKAHGAKDTRHSRWENAPTR